MLGRGLQVCTLLCSVVCTLVCSLEISLCLDAPGNQYAEVGVVHTLSVIVHKVDWYRTHAFYCAGCCTCDCCHWHLMFLHVVRRRVCTGGVQKPQKKNLIEDPKGTLGISDQFGFTKKNEVYSAQTQWTICLTTNQLFQSLHQR